MTETLTAVDTDASAKDNDLSGSTFWVPTRDSLDRFFWATIERSLGKERLSQSAIEDMLYRELAAHS